MTTTSGAETRAGTQTGMQTGTTASPGATARELPEFTPETRVVIIGAGVVGAALADELVLRGARQVTLLDQGPLFVTGGSSSHAPGFVFQTSGSRVMCRLAQRTLDKLEALDLDGRPLLKRVGGLEIATTEGQLAELSRRLGFAAAWGVPAQLITPQQVGELWPGLDTTTILGALHTPTDGVVHSRRAVEAQARRAEAGGARLLGLTRATGVSTEDGRITGVQVEDARTGQDARMLPADVVVAAGGIWGPLFGEILGITVPMHPMEHGFGWTGPLESLKGRGLEPEESERPMIRHQGSGLYFREYDDRIGIGAYEHRPLPLPPEELTDTAHMQETGRHPAMRELTPEDFAYCWDEVLALLPEARGSTVQDGFNGVFSFTPDGGPVLGPSPRVQGAWVAQAVWVTQSAGAAQVVADWIVSGDPGIDTHELDVNRFDQEMLSRRFVVEKAAQSYDEVYDIHFRHQPSTVMRCLKTSPFHPRMEALGARFLDSGGWERPLWFEANARLLAEAAPRIPRRDAWDSMNFSSIGAAEAWATRNRVAIHDMSSLTRLSISGPGSTAFLERVCSAKMDKSVGAVTYSLMLAEDGGILSDVTVARLGAHEYFMGCNGPLDLDRLNRLAPADGSVVLRDITQETCGLGLWGPHARDVAAPLAEADLSQEALKPFRSAQFFLAGVPVLALRVSYVGELGWELYTKAAYGLRLWDELMAAGAPYGIVAAGRLAFNSLRLEKGYRSWGADMNREDFPGPAGLGFAVSAKKTGFIGEGAQPTGPGASRRLVTVALRAETGIPEPGCPVFAPGRETAVGWVTSADHAYTVGGALAYAWVAEDAAAAGGTVEVLRFGRRLRGTIAADPVFDPEGLKIRR